MAGTTNEANQFIDWLAGTVEESWSSRRQFAEEAYIDPGGFSKILNRQTNYDVDTLKKIADRFERRREESGKGPSASEIVLRAFNLWGIDGRRNNAQDTNPFIQGGLEWLTPQEQELVATAVAALVEKLKEHRRTRAASKKSA